MTDPDMKNRHSRLRRCILETLYALFREFPYAQIELRQLQDTCETERKDLNWNIVYLEKCGYVELSKSDESLPYVATSATITAAGIDLIEDKERLAKKFPLSGN